MVKPPGSLPEGAVERSETEGVYFGERKRLKFSEPTMAYGYPLARSNQRTTLPQRGSRGRAAPFTRPPGNRKISGDFHRPYESSEEFTFYHSTDCTPSELVAVLQGQQFRLPGNSTGVSGQISICTNDPVAWDDDGYGIVTNSTAHRLGGNLRH